MGHKFERRDIKCPFCKEETLELKEHRPNKVASNQEATIYDAELIDDTCSECGKEREELEEKLKGMGYPL